MKKREQEFNTKFNRWLKYVHRRTGAYELKTARGTSLPFSAVAPHQKAALLQAAHSCLPWKISDYSLETKPFDSFMLCGTPAFVVIQFWRPGNKEFFMIPIDVWCVEEKISSRKSLVESRAREIGLTCQLG